MLDEQIQFAISENRNVCALRFNYKNDSLTILVNTISAEDQLLFRSSEGPGESQPETSYSYFEHLDGGTMAKKVIIIDDSKTIQQQIAKILTQTDYEMIEASDRIK